MSFNYSSKNSIEESRQIEAEVKHSMSLASNLDKLASSLETGEKIEAPKSREIHKTEGGILKPQAFSFDMGEVADGLVRNGTVVPNFSAKLSSFAPKNKVASLLMKELEELNLSSEEDILVVRNAIRTAAKDIKAQRVAENTRLVAKNAQKFYKTDDGMRVIFGILGNKFSLSAKGNFSGDEALYLQVTGDELEGMVFQKDANDNFVNVTKNFSIDISKA